MILEECKDTCLLRTGPSQCLICQPPYILLQSIQIKPIKLNNIVSLFPFLPPLFFPSFPLLSPFSPFFTLPFLPCRPEHLLGPDRQIHKPLPTRRSSGPLHPVRRRPLPAVLLALFRPRLFRQLCQPLL
jgi:hypothetical protein